MKWKEFRAGDVLDFNSSNGIFHACNVSIEDVRTESNHPYVVRTSKNNGIRGYISEDESKLNPANTISFAQDTAQMFYQSEPYFTGNKIKVLSVKGHILTEEIAMFLITCMNKAFRNFAWGSSYDTKLLQNVTLSLPVKESEEIDFDYMQEYIKELEQYLVVTGLNDYELTDEDKEILETKLNNGEGSLTSGNGYLKEARMFRVGDLFEVEGTKSLDAGTLEFKTNGINFVGRTDENNGIQGKIDKQSFEPNDANTLTATVIGNYKYVKYQEEPYYCSQNVNKLTPVFPINQLLGLYFRSIIQKFVSLYDGQQSGYKLDELRDYTFVLPIQTDVNNDPIIDSERKYHPDGYFPDWDFMEKYIRAIEKTVIADVVKFKDEKIAKTKEVVA